MTCWDHVLAQRRVHDAEPTLERAAEAAAVFMGTMLEDSGPGHGHPRGPGHRSMTFSVVLAGGNVTGYYACRLCGERIQARAYNLTLSGFRVYAGLRGAGGCA